MGLWTWPIRSTPSNTSSNPIRRRRLHTANPFNLLYEQRVFGEPCTGRYDNITYGDDSTLLEGIDVTGKETCNHYQQRY